MLITREKFVFPTTLAWMGLLIELGTLGFCAQVRSGQCHFRMRAMNDSSLDSVDNGTSTRDGGAWNYGCVYPGEPYGLDIPDVSFVTFSILCQIVFATILDRIFFHTIPSVLSVTGTLIIIASALYVAVSSHTSFIFYYILTVCATPLYS